MSKETEEQLAVKLEAVAAIAKSLAVDLRHGRLWEGDLETRLGLIQQEIRDVSILARRDS